MLLSEKDRTVYRHLYNNFSPCIRRSTCISWVRMKQSHKKLNDLFVAGTSPFDISVRFSKFFDAETSVGWNRNEKGKGEAFSFVNRRDWHLAIISGLFSHLGKHAPLLLSRAEGLPREVKEYLLFLRPAMKKLPQLPFMHGFVFGNFDSIDYKHKLKWKKISCFQQCDSMMQKSASTRCFFYRTSITK